MTAAPAQPPPHRFWQLNAGHLLSIAVYLAIAFVGYGRIAERMGNDSKRLAKVEQEIADLKRSGPIESAAIAKDIAAIKESQARMEQDIKWLTGRRAASASQVRPSVSMASRQDTR